MPAKKPDFGDDLLSGMVNLRHAIHHRPDFDFPDAILDPAMRVFRGIVARINGLDGAPKSS